MDYMREYMLSNYNHAWHREKKWMYTCSGYYYNIVITLYFTYVMM